MREKFMVRLILVNAALGENLKAEHIIYDKERAVKSTYAFGNGMGATIEVSHEGKRQTVRFIPRTDYANNSAYVIMRKDAEGLWTPYCEVSSDDDALRVLFPKDFEHMVKIPEPKVNRKNSLNIMSKMRLGLWHPKPGDMPKDTTITTNVLVHV